MKHKCLSIAGFDGSGGAGIQADLKTFSALGCYGMTVLTALPVQNTTGVKSYYDIPLQAIKDQLEAIFSDIVPDSIKIGMLFSEEIIDTVADFLEKYAENIPIILDPVMVAKSGHLLLLPNAISKLKTRLIPIAELITPNIPEARELVSSDLDAQKVAEDLLALGPRAVLLKGGHLKGNTSDDLFLDTTGKKVWLDAIRIKSKNTHGTGCTLSAAICANMALGMPLLEACKQAKIYLTKAIYASMNSSVGKGNGPVNHFFSTETNYYHSPN